MADRLFDEGPRRLPKQRHETFVTAVSKGNTKQMHGVGLEPKQQRQKLGLVAKARREPLGQPCEGAEQKTWTEGRVGGAAANICIHVGLLNSLRPA